MKWLYPLWCFCHESHQNIQFFSQNKVQNCSCLLRKLPWLTRLQHLLMQQPWLCSCHHYLLLLCMQHSCLCALICCLQGVIPLLHQQVTLLHVPVNRETPWALLETQGSEPRAQTEKVTLQSTEVLCGIRGKSQTILQDVLISEGWEGCAWHSRDFISWVKCFTSLKMSHVPRVLITWYQLNFTKDTTSPTISSPH